MQYLVDAFVMGIAYGIGPCTLFCAPLIIPLIISSSKDGKEGFIQTVLFGFGRVFSYIILGMISGLVGIFIGNLVSNRFIGVVMIVLGILMLLKKHPKTCLFINSISKNKIPFLTGLIVGLSPCYPLIGAMSLAVSSKSVLNGLLIGLIFGVGTVLSPLLLLGFLAGKWAKFSSAFYKINLIVCSSFLIILGLLNLLAG